MKVKFTIPKEEKKSYDIERFLFVLFAIEVVVLCLSWYFGG